MPRRPLLSFMVAALLVLAPIGCDRETASEKWERENNVFDPGQDPRFKAAEQEAIRRYPEFVAAFRKPKAGQHFSVKAKFVDGDAVEWMWVAVTAIDPAGNLTGTLDNDPVGVKNVKAGDKVKVAKGDIDDWIIVDASGVTGAFTIKVIEQMQAERAGKKK